jgi:hypothetical protein
MTPDEAIKKLDALDAEDQESAHVEAEEIVLRLLRHHGFADVADAFERAKDRVRFWYA